MKNLIVYYIAILMPIPLLYWLVISGYTGWFTFGLLFYSLPYRTVVDGFRLVNLRVIKPREIWKLLMPGARIKYTKDLYLTT